MNNPPAFPHFPSKAHSHSEAGMTLRDYFAAAALQGFLANALATTEWINKFAVKSAFSIADSMLKAREE